MHYQILMWFLLGLSSVFSQSSFGSSKSYKEFDFQSINSGKDTLEKTHSVTKAILFSAVLPGAGQVYNHTAMPKGKRKAFWKVPLIYAGLGATTYFMIKNQQQSVGFKREYQNRQNGDLPSETYQQYDDLGLLTAYQNHLARRDRAILGLGLVYFLQIADAGIEAHFVRFDISEDLSLQVRPVMMSFQHVGIGFKLAFK